MDLHQNFTRRPVPWVAALVSLTVLLPWKCIAKTNTDSTLTLEHAIHIAQTQDAWLDKSQQEQQRLMALSEGARAWADPTINIGLVNLPTDGFAFDQEPMTQLKVGASQLFPRGDTLALKESQLLEAAEIQPIQRANRKQKVAWLTKQLWLDAYLHQTSYALVKDAQPLFDKLLDIVSASYISSVGKASQQDLIRAELELTRLQDRLVTLETEQRSALSKLTQFLIGSEVNAHGRNIGTRYDSVGFLPSQEQQFTDVIVELLSLENPDEHKLYPFIMRHPLVIAKAQQIAAERIGIDIAQQSYQPQFGVNASYALRDNAPEAQGGDSRADFLSIGVSVSFPLFSTSKQDALVSSTIHQVEAIKTEKLLLMRELMAALKTNIAHYQGSSERLNLYREKILPQMSQQSTAALNAYTNDIGDFSEVVRAKIAELDAQITAISIDVAKRKALAAIEYYLTQYELPPENQLKASFMLPQNSAMQSNQGSTND